MTVNPDNTHTYIHMIHGHTHIHTQVLHRQTNTNTQTHIYRQTESYCAVRECQYRPKVKQCDLSKESFHILTKRTK